VVGGNLIAGGEMLHRLWGWTPLELRAIEKTLKMAGKNY